MDDSFLVHVAGENRGPYTQQQLKSMWDLGALTSDTLYWREDIQTWCPLREFLAPATENVTSQDAVLPHLEYRLATFWPRFSARLLDLQIYGLMAPFIVDFCMALFNFRLSPSTYTGAIFCVMFTIEGIWLSVANGTTAGKWFFGLRLKVDSAKPASVYTQRAISVMWRCTPLLAPFCAFFAERDIARTGSTKWDKKYRSQVFLHNGNQAKSFLGGIVLAAFLLYTFVQLAALLPKQ